MNRRIIQVGAGNWGQSWLQFVHDSKDWELAALVSRGGENLAKAKQKWSIPDDRIFSTLGEAIRATPSDAVLVTAYHALHVPLAIEALEAGRHVLVEKPLSDDFAQARNLVDVASRSGCGAWVCQNFRFREGIWRLRRSLTQGELGRLLALRVLFRRSTPAKPNPWPQEWRRRQWSFLLNEITIHHFDMCRFVTGRDAEWVWCHGWALPWNPDGPESVSAVVGLRDGPIMDYSGRIRALAGPNTLFDGDWLIETDRGCASWAGQEPAWEPGKGEAGALLDAKGFPGFDRGGVLTELAGAIEGRTPAILPTAEDNLKSLAMVFAAIRSSREGRKVELREILED